MIATTDLVIHIYAKQENVSEHKEILPAMTEERTPLYMKPQRQMDYLFSNLLEAYWENNVNNYPLLNLTVIVNM